MKIKKFVKEVKKLLNLKDVETENKKKSMKILLKKLIKRKRDVTKKLESDPKKEVKKSLKEDLDILKAEIKKAKRIIHKLYSKKK